MKFHLKAIKIVCFLFCISLLFACNNASTNTNENSKLKVEENILKIFISGEGEIFSNGELVSVEDLKQQLNDLSDSEGEVHYSRAEKAKEPHPNAMTAIGLIIEKGLPIQFYSDNSFEEVVSF